MGKIRKVRSDKKREVKPTVSQSIYNCISDISYITNTPMGEFSVYLIEEGIQSLEVMDILSKEFQRPYHFNDYHIMMGIRDTPRSRVIKQSGQTSRLPIRINKWLDIKIENVAYALGATHTSATYSILKIAIKNTKIIDKYLAKNIYDNLDKARQKQLKIVYDFIHKETPFTFEDQTSFIKWIIEKGRGIAISGKKAIEIFLEEQPSIQTNKNNIRESKIIINGHIIE